MTNPPRRTLTVSAVDAFVECEGVYDFSYNRAVYPTDYPSALAIGSAVHVGAEALKKGEGLPAALDRAAQTIVVRLEESLPYLALDRAVEVREQAARDQAKTSAMLRFYFERTHEGGPSELPLDCELDFTAVEAAFHEPLINPATGAASRTFLKAGKADGIVSFRARPEAGLLIFELKTTGDTLDDLEEALRHSLQTPTYQELASRMLGRPVLGAVVDILKKPAVRGRKDESLADFEERCLSEYRAEPERFFRRVEIPHDEARVREAQAVFWRTAQAIRDADRHGYLLARGRKCRKSFGWCPFRALCWYGQRDGYRLSDMAHEELGIEA